MDYFFNFDKLDYLTGKKPDGCILCLVRDGSGEVPSLVVHETASSMVSLNLYPYNPGHLLVFPRRHARDVRELTAEERADIDALSRLCLDMLDSTHGPAGYNIGYNMGLVAGASIDHLHLHIIPRYPREIGIAELLAGSRVLVQNPLETRRLLRARFAEAAEAAARAQA
ncbi:MAG: HIT domain-containing protein [Spirochaetes bacterium]|nr:HIT domain-containing protein [Spirochaetota bacterium]MBU1080729.1 HIT domain-containing protein [Spirochaetota bacterium]